MKKNTLSLFFLFCCVTFFFANPAIVNASLYYNPPIKKTKVTTKKHRKKDINTRKKSIKQEGKFYIMNFILPLLITACITGIVLLIVGLVLTNPTFWIVGVCLIVASIITMLCILLKKKSRRPRPLGRVIK